MLAEIVNSFAIRKNQFYEYPIHGKFLGDYNKNEFSFFVLRLVSSFLLYTSLLLTLHFDKKPFDTLRKKNESDEIILKSRRNFNNNVSDTTW